MKIYLYINPVTNRPFQFSFIKSEEAIIANNEKQPDGSYITVHYKPIIIEVEKYDVSLLNKEYNPETKKLEDS